MEISKESWEALVDASVDDANTIQSQQKTIRKLVGQIEKLSWLLEKTVEWYVEPEYGVTLEDIEDNWVDRGKYL